MKRTLVTLLCSLLLLIMGCESGGFSLRFAPKEQQKQTAWLTAELARKIEAEGTVPGSPAAEKVVKGTRVAAYYMGAPKVPADIEQFDTIAPMAEEQAQQRPDVWSVADNALELGIGVAAILGTGGAGTVLVQRLKKLRQKSKALEQVVKGNEIFKAEKIDFKTAHKGQSPETKTLVAEIRAST